MDTWYTTFKTSENKNFIEVVTTRHGLYITKWTPVWMDYLPIWKQISRNPIFYSWMDLCRFLHWHFHRWPIDDSSKTIWIVPLFRGTSCLHNYGDNSLFFLWSKIWWFRNTSIRYSHVFLNSFCRLSNNVLDHHDPETFKVKNGRPIHSFMINCALKH